MSATESFQKCPDRLKTVVGFKARTKFVLCPFTITPCLITTTLISSSNTHWVLSSQTSVGWQTLWEAYCYFIVILSFVALIFPRSLQKDRGHQHQLPFMYVGVVVIMVHPCNESPWQLLGNVLVLYKALSSDGEPCNNNVMSMKRIPAHLHHF